MLLFCSKQLEDEDKTGLATKKKTMWLKKQNFFKQKQKNNANREKSLATDWTHLFTFHLKKWTLHNF